MLFPLAILLLLLNVAREAASEKHKRWISVQPLKDDKVKGQFGPWPLVCSSQSIRYCFADSRSQKNLENIVNQAVAKWSHAFLNSRLEIIPNNEEYLICKDQEVRADALVIFDATKDNDKAWNDGPDCPTDSATTGYDYSSKERGRHRLDFCHLDPQDNKGTEALAVRTMMHELGHAIGLNHEHQRNDRGDFLTFVCENLDGYGEAKKLAGIDEKAYFEDDDPMEDRMALTCNDDEIASDYLPSAVAFIRAKDHRLPDPKKKWKGYTRSEAFDYDSIMMYNSHANSPANVDASRPEHWVIKRKDNGGPVWQGGSEHALDAKITEGDVARVAQLYPKADGSSEDAMKLGEWGVAKGKKLRVKVRGVELIVAPPRWS